MTVPLDAAAEVLQVINSSPGDLEPALEAMLEKAVRRCQVTFGIMQTYDGAQFRTAALHGVPSAFAEWRRYNPPIFQPSEHFERSFF